MLNTLVLLIKRQSNVFKTIFYQVILICLSDDTHTQEEDKKSFAQDVFKVYSQARTCSMQLLFVKGCLVPTPLVCESVLGYQPPALRTSPPQCHQLARLPSLVSPWLVGTQQFLSADALQRCRSSPPPRSTGYRCSLAQRMPRHRYLLSEFW
jgi:hypothetical protein